MDALLPHLAAKPTDGSAVISEPLAFADVYRQHLPYVFRAARALGVPPAALDDVVQEVFVVVYRRLDAVEDAAGLRSWLAGILLNVARHHRRTFGRKSPHARPGSKPADPDGLASAAPDPYAAVVLGESARQLQRVLDSLDDDKREILVLVELEELPVSEAAEILGLKLNTGYSRLRAARHAFDEALARDRARSRGAMR